MANILLKGTVVDDSWVNQYYEEDGEPIIYPNAVRDLITAAEGEDLTIELNSYGGSVWAGAEIATMLEEHKGKVTVQVSGIAASIASVIAMAADEVVMTPLSCIMIHNPASYPMSFSLTDMRKTVAQLEGIADNIVNIYKKRTGLSTDKLKKMMDDETYIMADEAIKLGFADRKSKATDAEQTIVNSLITNAVNGQFPNIEAIMKERNSKEMAKKQSIFERLTGVTKEVLNEVEPEKVVEPPEVEPEAEPEVTPEVTPEPETEPEVTEEATEVEELLDAAAETIETLQTENASLKAENDALKADLDNAKKATAEVTDEKNKMSNSVATKMRTLNSLIEKIEKADTAPKKAVNSANSEWTYNGFGGEK